MGLRQIYKKPYVCVLNLFSHIWLCNPIDHSPPGSSVHGTFQARMLEWVAMPSSKDLPDPGIEPMSPALADVFFTTGATWEAHKKAIINIKYTCQELLSYFDVLILSLRLNILLIIMEIISIYHFKIQFPLINVKNRESLKVNSCSNYQMDACLLSCFSCVWLLATVRTGLPGFSIHGILQPRMLEWVPRWIQ